MARADSITEVEILAYLDATLELGNDAARIGARLGGREELTPHARRIYASGNLLYIRNRLKSMRRCIAQRDAVAGHLPPDPNSRDGRFAYDLENVMNPQALQDMMMNAEEREAADPVAAPQEEDDPQPGPANDVDGQANPGENQPARDEEQPGPANPSPENQLPR